MNQVQTHKTYGLITGLAVVVIAVIFYVAGISFESYTQWLVYIPFLVGLILNAQAFSKANNGYVTFGQTFSSCFKATAIITLIVLAWTFASSYIFPEMQQKAMEMAREKMEKDSKITEEQIEMSMEMTRKYWTLFMVMGVVFGYMFFGAIFSLIAAATAKKKGAAPPPSFDSIQA